MELFLDVLGETLVDTAKMLPFLFLAYLLIEYIEHRHGERIEALLAGGGRWGAVPGAVLGCVPQCGCSAIASNFYASRVITLGTLMAVYLATSDEAIPLLVSMPAYWDKLAVLMVIKVVYAIVVGFVLDFVLRGMLPKGLRGGGGTDFRPAFAYVDRLCAEKKFSNLRGLLYFTDGMGTYPAKRPAYDTAFLFLGERFDDANVPPWAMKVVLDEEEFTGAAARPASALADALAEEDDLYRDLNNS